jgi:lipoprotein-releasing system ATP-binding protein
MNDTKIIHIESLYKTYSSETESLTILSDLSMDIEKGQKVVILGESGSGKSTLLNIIAGLDVPTQGIVEIGPYSVGTLSEKDLAGYRSKYIGLIFQFHYLLKDFTALENVMMPLYMQGVGKKEAEEKAKTLLYDVGLESRMSHYPAQLSGGERQRTAVARALIHNPELILADEPTGNLDPANGEKISDLLFSMVEKYHKTLVMVTHEQKLASRAHITCRIVNGKLSIV